MADASTSTVSGIKQAGAGARPLFVSYPTSIMRKKTGDGYVSDAQRKRRYYSQVDTEIYFGDEYVEDIISMQFSVMQNTMPIFGYNSYTMDSAPRGSRMVQGSFGIHFTSPGYLFRLLERVSEQPVYNYNYIFKKTGVPLPFLAEQKIVQDPRKANNGPIWHAGFDIDIMYGQKTTDSNPVHLVITNLVLNNCTQQQDAYSPGGIIETYSFIAKDIRAIE